MYVNRIHILHPLEDKDHQQSGPSYVDEVYTEFGGSLKILSDNGTEFKNQLSTDVVNQLGVECNIHFPPFHPQSNGKN